MTRTRLVVAGIISALLIALLGWQVQREKLVKACLDGGGAWTGNSCGPSPNRPILLRDLRRS
jgi:hypothetical protein